MPHRSQAAGDWLHHSISMSVCSSMLTPCLSASFCPSWAIFWGYLILWWIQVCAQFFCLPASTRKGYVVALHIPGSLRGIVPHGISLWDSQGVPKIPEASVWGCQALACGPHLSCHWFLGGLRAKSGFYSVLSDSKNQEKKILWCVKNDLK